MICNCRINQECLKVNSEVVRDFKMLYLSSCPPLRAASFFGQEKVRQQSRVRDLRDRRNQGRIADYKLAITNSIIIRFEGKKHLQLSSCRLCRSCGYANSSERIQ